MSETNDPRIQPNHPPSPGVLSSQRNSSGPVSQPANGSVGVQMPTPTQNNGGLGGNISPSFTVASQITQSSINVGPATHFMPQQVLPGGVTHRSTSTGLPYRLNGLIPGTQVTYLPMGFALNSSEAQAHALSTRLSSPGWDIESPLGTPPHTASLSVPTTPHQTVPTSLGGSVGAPRLRPRPRPRPQPLPLSSSHQLPHPWTGVTVDLTQSSQGPTLGFPQVNSGLAQPPPWLQAATGAYTPSVDAPRAVSVIELDTTTAGTRTPPRDISPPPAKRARPESPQEPPIKAARGRGRGRGHGRGQGRGGRGGNAKGKERAETQPNPSDDKNVPTRKLDKGKGKATAAPELTEDDLARASIAPIPSSSRSQASNPKISTGPSSSNTGNRDISTGPTQARQAQPLAPSELGDQGEASIGVKDTDTYRATADDKKALIGFIFDPQTFDANNLNLSDAVKQASTKLFDGRWSWQSIRDYVTLVKRKYACYERIMARSGTIRPDDKEQRDRFHAQGVQWSPEHLVQFGASEIYDIMNEVLHNRPEIRKQFEFDSSRTLEDEENEAQTQNNEDIVVISDTDSDDDENANAGPSRLSKSKSKPKPKSGTKESKTSEADRAALSVMSEALEEMQDSRCDYNNILRSQNKIAQGQLDLARVEQQASHKRHEAEYRR